MPLLKSNDQALLKEELKNMSNPVRLAFFTQALDCETCEITLQILQEVSDLSDKLELVTYNFAIDKEAVARYHISRIPAVAVLRLDPGTEEGESQQAVERDYGLRFYGVPSGYEFMSLIGDILDVSKGDSGLSMESRLLVSQVKDPIHFQVFTTPT